MGPASLKTTQSPKKSQELKGKDELVKKVKKEVPVVGTDIRNFVRHRLLINFC